MAGTFSPPPVSITPSRMSPFGFVGGNRTFVMPYMTSPDSWSNNPSFGMRIKGVNYLGDDVTIRKYGSRWNSVYLCFYRSSYSGELPLYPEYMFCDQSGRFDASIVMEFERPLKITNIRWKNEEYGKGSYHTFSISAGPEGDEEELIRQTEYAIGQNVYFDHFIPADKQRYAFRYTIKPTQPNSGWSSGRLEIWYTIQIVGVW